MKIGADSWIYEEPFKGHEDAVERRKQHEVERAAGGMSTYDWWNADTFICGIIAVAARRFSEEGMGYPGYMTEDEWNETLKGIYEPLETYVENKFNAVSAKDELEMHEAVKDALHAFADYSNYFWD